jgi:uncharacterized protein YndB with AHSA1/START domain
MPNVARRRVIGAPVETVWSVVSDPYHLPRWWPKTIRVENVRGGSGERRSHWTTVLTTQSGRPVRADFQCLSSAANERFVWEQELADTPFERILRRSVLEIHLRPADGATEVELTSRQTLRGLSRLGSPMMRRATVRMLNDALDGLEEAVT